MCSIVRRGSKIEEKQLHNHQNDHVTVHIKKFLNITFKFRKLADQTILRYKINTGGDIYFIPLQH